MSKLNQIIAVVNGKKTAIKEELTKAYHLFQKKELLEGINRTYKPKDEEGDQLPPEEKKLQLKVKEVFETLRSSLASFYDLILQQDTANCEAKADIVVGGKVIASGVPVTYLLFLEKQLIDLKTLMVDKVPTLDPTETWSWSEEADAYANKPSGTTRTKKIKRAFIKYEATTEHPAQVDTFDEDVIVGTWTTQKFSGAIPLEKKNEMLARIVSLQEAIKFAREQANMLETKQVSIGKTLINFILES